MLCALCSNSPTISTNFFLYSQYLTPNQVFKHAHHTFLNFNVNLKFLLSKRLITRFSKLAFHTNRRSRFSKIIFKFSVVDFTCICCPMVKLSFPVLIQSTLADFNYFRGYNNLRQVQLKCILTCDFLGIDPKIHLSDIF